MQIQLKAASLWIYNQAIDFRKSIDGIVTLIHGELKLNPSKGVYIFLIAVVTS